MKSYSLNFKGYWRDVNRSYIPNTSGVYLVYKCTFHSQSNTVSLLDLIYIGQSKNMRERAEEHYQKKDFPTEQGEEICYSIVELPFADLSLVENALVFAQQPSYNSSLKNSYSFPTAQFDIGGKCGLMKYQQFTINS